MAPILRPSSSICSSAWYHQAYIFWHYRLYSLYLLFLEAFSYTHWLARWKIYSCRTRKWKYFGISSAILYSSRLSLFSFLSYIWIFSRISDKNSLHKKRSSSIYRRSCFCFSFCFTSRVLLSSSRRTSLWHPYRFAAIYHLYSPRLYRERSCPPLPACLLVYGFFSRYYHGTSSVLIS